MQEGLGWCEIFTLLRRWSLWAYHGLGRQHIDAGLNEAVIRYDRRF